ncbi:putative zinc ribbon protein, partial [Escherichia coli]|uniref:putative zinc ribbon protein n=1 Tax=Escherichia coli TaxID=562 RepID=UPI003896C2F0
LTVPDYTGTVRTWFWVMWPDHYAGETGGPRWGTGVYSRPGGRQEGNWKDRN